MLATGSWFTQTKAAACRLRLIFSRARNTYASGSTTTEGLGGALYANSLYLIGHGVVTSASGFLFWLLAARFFSAGDVGLGAALTSVALLLAFLSSFGLEFALVRFLPSDQKNASGLINSCFALSSAMAILMAVIFLLGTPFWAPRLAFVGESVLLSAGFVAAVAGAPVYALLNQIYVAARRAEFTLLQGSLTSLLRVAGLTVLASLGTAMGIFVAWGVSVVVVLLIGLLLFLPRVQPQYRLLVRAQGRLTSAILRFSLANYVSAGFSRMPALLLPIIVVNSLGGELNAYFFVAWAVAGRILAIPVSISESIFAVGSARQEELHRHVKRGLKLTVVLLLPTLLVVIVAADKLLLLFGEAYAASGTSLLRVLAVSALPAAANAMYLGIARVQKSLGRIMVVSGVVAGVTLGLSFVLIPVLGILGPGMAWLAANTLAATISFPEILRQVRQGP